MRPVSIACIVEGYGDVAAFPVLLQRIVREPVPMLILYVPRQKIVKPGELEKAVELAALKNQAPGAILILLDAEEDCPAILAPELLKRAICARSDTPIAVVLAERE